MPVEPDEAIVSVICANCGFVFTGELAEARGQFAAHECGGLPSLPG